MLPLTSETMKLLDTNPRYEIGLVVGRAQDTNAIRGALWEILVVDGIQTIHIQSIKPLFDEEGKCLDRTIVR